MFAEWCAIRRLQTKDDSTRTTFDIAFTKLSDGKCEPVQRAGFPLGGSWLGWECLTPKGSTFRLASLQIMHA